MNAAAANADAARDRRERAAIDARSAPQPAPARVRGVCGDCVAFDSSRWSSGARGDCKARPPVVAVTEGGIETVFPVVSASGWCMGFKPA